MVAGVELLQPTQILSTDMKVCRLALVLQCEMHKEGGMYHEPETIVPQPLPIGLIPINLNHLCSNMVQYPKYSTAEEFFARVGARNESEMRDGLRILNRHNKKHGSPQFKVDVDDGEVFVSPLNKASTAWFNDVLMHSALQDILKEGDEDLIYDEYIRLDREGVSDSDIAKRLGTDLYIMRAVVARRARVRRAAHFQRIGREPPEAV